MPERSPPLPPSPLRRGAARVVVRLRAAWPRLRRDRSGAAALEFAIVAAPFFGFILLIFQVALYYFSLQSLDYATRLAARQVMTGGVTAVAKSANGFKSTLVCPHVLWGIDCNKVVVNAYRVGKINDQKAGAGIYQFVQVQTKTLAAVQTDPQQQSFCLGGPGDLIFLDVAYTYTNFVGSLLSAGKPGPDGFLMRSTSFIFNEPFASAGAPTC